MVNGLHLYSTFLVLLINIPTFTHITTFFNTYSTFYTHLQRFLVTLTHTNTHTHDISGAVLVRHLAQGDFDTWYGGTGN